MLGPTKTQIWIACFRVQSANHYTIGPSTLHAVPVIIITLTLSQLGKKLYTHSDQYKFTCKYYGTVNKVGQALRAYKPYKYKV